MAGFPIDGHILYMLAVNTITVNFKCRTCVQVSRDPQPNCSSPAVAIAYNWNYDS